MSKQNKTYFNWSTGKDSSLALYYIMKDQSFDIDLLFTSVNAHHNRVSMHGLRKELLEIQANSIGIPLETLDLPENPSMDSYNEKMTVAVNQLTSKGFTDCVFGDIFLEDLRIYREEQLTPFGIKSHFPLWKQDTTELITKFIDLGFKAIVLSLNASVLDKSFLGRVIDHDFINDLPDNVDPCGENGEFHTFCFDGPIFKKPINFTKGEEVFKEYKSPTKDSTKNIGFWFLDLIPNNTSSN